MPVLLRLRPAMPEPTLSAMLLLLLPVFSPRWCRNSCLSKALPVPVVGAGSSRLSGGRLSASLCRRLTPTRTAQSPVLPRDVEAVPVLLAVLVGEGGREAATLGDGDAAWEGVREGEDPKDRVWEGVACWETDTAAREAVLVLLRTLLPVLVPVPVPEEVGGGAGEDSGPGEGGVGLGPELEVGAGEGEGGALDCVCVGVGGAGGSDCVCEAVFDGRVAEGDWV